MPTNDIGLYLGLYSLSGGTSYGKKPRDDGIGCYNDPIALKINWRIDSTAAEVPVKFQNDWKSLNQNLTVWRLHEILWQDVHRLSEWRHWVFIHSAYLSFAPYSLYKIAGSPKASKRWDSGLDFPFTQCCRNACQMSARWDHFTIPSRRLETSRYLKTSVRLVNRGPVYDLDDVQQIGTRARLNIKNSLFSYSDSP